ncbi:hypothetical protein ACG02S_25980 [Roseateles sp. DC23W]|uniref:Uncharacterized protein n=1 Tax=Pelomonas dachongensis TaxID=3299029 RepID=A0ABW7EV17_9BURK
MAHATSAPSKASVNALTSFAERLRSSRVENWEDARQPLRAIGIEPTSCVDNSNTKWTHCSLQSKGVAFELMILSNPFGAEGMWKDLVMQLPAKHSAAIEESDDLTFLKAHGWEIGESNYPLNLEIPEENAPGCAYTARSNRTALKNIIAFELHLFFRRANGKCGKELDTSQLFIKKLN